MKKKLLLALLSVCCVSVCATGCTGCTSCGLTPPPEDGKSAYQIWLDNGHEGTEEDFLNWLRGDDGEAQGTKDLHYQRIPGREEYRVVGIGMAEETSIVVPSTYKGLPVTAIHDHAFAMEYIEEIVLPDSVKTISDYAFMGCTDLKSVTLGGMVSEIGQEAFYACTALSEIVLPNSVQTLGVGAFYGCESLTEMAIPGSVENIGEMAFANCSALSDLTIGDGVENIEERAFADCVGLTEVVVPDSVQNIGSSAFDGCDNVVSMTLPFVGESKDLEEENKALAHVFDGYATLKKVTVTGGDLVDGALADCSALVSVTLGAEVTEVVTSAFDGCVKLENFVVDTESEGYSSVDGILYDKEKTTVVCAPVAIMGNITLPDTLEVIPEDCFEGRARLTSIRVPASVTTIGADAFKDCSVLPIYCEVASRQDGWDNDWNSSSRAVVWNCANNGLASNGIVYVLSEGVQYKISGGVATVTRQAYNILTADIKDSISYQGVEYPVTAMEIGAFSGCTQLTSVRLSNALTKIPELAFNGCVALRSVEIPDSVTSIDLAAFYVCSNLKEVVIGDGVTQILREAFYGCGSLETLVLSNSVETVGGNAFGLCNNLSSVYYEGTQTEWAAMDLSADGNNKLLSATRYYYVENEADLPTDDGNYWHYVDGVPTAW